MRTWAQPVLVLLAVYSKFVRADQGPDRAHDISLNGIQNPFIHGPDFIHAITPKEPTWLEKYGPQIDQTFSGPLSFSHLPYHRCLENEDIPFDVALLGMPFDTAVTYRPG
jgi:hypothetical protein